MASQLGKRRRLENLRAKGQRPAAILRPASRARPNTRGRLQSPDVYVFERLWISELDISRTTRVKFSLAETEIIDGVSTGGVGGEEAVRSATRERGERSAPTITKRRVENCLRIVPFVESGSLARTTQGRFASASFPPPLRRRQRQHKATGERRQSDVLWFILPESLRMLSVPHEGSDESRLSGRHLIISQKSL